MMSKNKDKNKEHIRMVLEREEKQSFLKIKEHYSVKFNSEVVRIMMRKTKKIIDDENKYKLKKKSL